MGEICRQRCLHVFTSGRTALCLERVLRDSARRSLQTSPSALSSSSLLLISFSSFLPLFSSVEAVWAPCRLANMSTSIRAADGQYHDHLRRLLDQRTARAGLHGRFPSSSLSEFSASPSIYSHAPFSPRLVDRTDDDGYASSSHYRRPSEPSSPMSDRQRLENPNASSLDLDDDSRSSSVCTTRIEDDDSKPLLRITMNDTQSETTQALSMPLLQKVIGEGGTTPVVNWLHDDGFADFPRLRAISPRQAPAFVS